ncbi:MAG TPA: hypothetical protein VK090_05360 [Paracoccaceae bacterium]|nr:hypothetical protein [Paracoccaceae bacterium]
MSFILPEILRAARQYAEPAIYAGIAAFFFWKAIGAAGRGAWLGLVLLVPGALAAFAAIGTAERALIAHGRARMGPGVVRVHERRITYLGPHGGASIAIDALVRIDIVTDRFSLFTKGARWELTDEEGNRLSIPAGAEDAEALLDALGALPGFNNMAVLLALRGEAQGRHPIWRRKAALS